MLKFYKNHQTMLQAKEQEDTKENIPHSILDPNISKEYIQWMATCHLKMTKAATKIQAFGCGYMVHKFDKHSMMKVITWVNGYQQQILASNKQDDEEKKDDDLPEPQVTTWIEAWEFLMENQEIVNSQAFAKSNIV